MKKLAIILTGILLSTSTVVFAGPLEEKQLMLQAIQWEYKYNVMRNAMLEIDAKSLTGEIKSLINKKKIAEEAIKTDAKNE